ncbi:CLUMA_CG001397, isoform A [Clunio marinus]|uniref:Aminopeptidase N n=1 Tax=Clunio marinus TaxID=568069 RepID=A0A1J1HMY9_9DIPT|nr:CLUMA_CG001397, isoform A [Clunio marinus]
MEQKDCLKVKSKVVRRISDVSADTVSLDARRKIKYGGPLTAVWGMFVEFSGNTSIHGLQYLGERRRHWVERVFWVVALVISVIGCSIMINRVYKKWNTSPVIVSFAEKSTPVWQIPFPAVTICPETKALKKHIDFTEGFTMKLHNNTDNLTIDQLKNLEAVAQICDPHLLKDLPINSGLEANEIVPLLKSITMPLNETTLFCKWRNTVLPCTDYFTEILTEEGFCYTFNILDASELFKEDVLADDFKYQKHNISSDEWTLEDGYSTFSPTTYPRRVLGSGSRAGLNIVLKLTEPDLDYICRGPVQGFKILLHTPGEIPRVSKQYFRVPLSQEVVVSVKPNMITTSEGLADYAPERRQCFFNDERHLKFFRVYTQSNCELECLANFTLDQCKCVKFSMPRDTETRICTQSEVSCYDSAEDNLMKLEFTQSLTSGSGVNKLGQTSCNCLPSCTSIVYDAEISQADFEFEKMFNSYAEDYLDELPGAILARLTIFFKEAQFITSKRSELYGLSEFMANCGGLLGLFMGVSILSLMEIVYYITLRLSCNLNNRRQKRIRERKQKMSMLSVEPPAQRRLSVLSMASEAGSENEHRRKIKYGGPLAAAWGMFADFSNNSTIHGVQYFAEKRRHWTERAFWVIAFLVSVIGCSILIHKIYEKWQLSPVIVSFAEKSTPVWQIPFPAVTICPETKAMVQHVDFTKGYRSIHWGERDNLTEFELRGLEAVAQICDPHLFTNISIDSGLKVNEIVPLLKSITMSLNETTLFCKWRNTVLPCTDYFTEILTEEGFCYTFNVLDASELFKEDVLADDFKYQKHNISSDKWTLEDGYSTIDPSTYPRRVLGPGARAGLNIVLKLTEPDLDYICRGPVQGFKILLHTPGEIPRVSKQYFRVPLRQEVVVSVKPNMITTSEGLADYAPERRQCYFNNERNLKFFKVYTQSNCELECLANFTLGKCGCVKFSMPRDTETRICTQTEVFCYDSAEDDLMETELTQSLKSGSGVNKFGKTSCNCLPSCTSINYDAEISQADYEYVKVFNAYGGDLNEFPGAILARLTIFFKEAQFITSKRSELYGLTDFMANCGGLLEPGFFRYSSCLFDCENIKSLSGKMILRIIVMSFGFLLVASKVSLPSISQFADDIDGISYRLPNETIPLEYDLQLTTEIHSGEKRFTGTVKITLKVIEATSKITLHMRQLTVENITLTPSDSLTKVSIDWDNVTATEFLIITASETLVVNDDYNLEIDYFGFLRDDNMGFYRSSYKDSSGQTVWLAATQFEETDARHAFPCYDEPQFRTPFRIKIKHHSDYSAISNMPGDTFVEKEPPNSITTFEETPDVQTYLIAFIVAKFESVSNDDVNTIQNVFARPESIDNNEADFALEVGTKVLEKFKEHFEVDYSLPKLDQVALPDLNGGAMENWGLVTYREEYLLLNPSTATTRQRENILTVISHEYAHQWFGNHVAPKWWSYLWLNEGFATLYGNFMANLVYPEDRLMDTFVVDVVQTVLEVDASTTIRPMTFYVENPDRIKALFDRVGYEKSGSVLRMMQVAFGDDTFTKGLRYYLNVNKFKAATSDDLYTGLQRSIDEDYSLNAPNVEAIFRTWETQSGYPLVTVTRNNFESLTIKQERFFYTTKETSDNLWWIPINYVVQSNPDFTNTKPDFWIEGTESLQLANNATKSWQNDDWIILNIQQTSYYRVNYDNDLWELLIQQLNVNHTEIHVLNRAQLIDDSLNLARGGRISYEIPLRMLEYLENESDYIPWASAYRGLNFLNRLLKDSPIYDDYNNFVQRIISPLYERLSLNIDDKEHKLDRYARNVAVNLACEAGHSKCLSETNESFIDFILKAVEIHPDLKSSIYCNGLKTNVVNSFNNMKRKLTESNDQAERTLIIDALSCIQNENLLYEHILNSTKFGNNFRLHEKSRMVMSLLNNGETALLVLIKLIRNEYETLISILTTTQFSTMLSSISSRVTSQSLNNEFNSVLSYLESNNYITENSVNSYRASALANIEWQGNNFEFFKQWFQVTTTTLPSDITDETTEEGAGSIMISLVLLTLCSLIKYLL